MVAPVLTGPVDVAATQGSPAVLSVSAAGDAPFTYQWYRVGFGYLLNQAAEDLTFPTAMLADSGAEFYCIVTDAFDLSTQSANATLTVNPFSTVAPVVIGPPDRTVNAGDEVSFNVTASGNGPFAYQWYLFTGGVIAGATDRTLTFTTLPADNGKGYLCDVTDISGLVTRSAVARLVVLGDSLPGTADIDYPCGLPGVLVNSNAYQSSDRTRRNPLQAGPPLVRLENDDGYEMFDVAWSFDAAQVQAFRNWFRFETVSGSKRFNIELWIDGFDGIKQTRTHECEFNGPPSYNQVGKRWSVSATLIAITEQGLDECGSVVAIINGFPDLPLEDPHPGFPDDPELPECQPYSCSALRTGLANIMWEVWPMFDPAYTASNAQDLINVNGAIPLKYYAEGSWGAGNFRGFPTVNYDWDGCPADSAVIFSTIPGFGTATLSHFNAGWTPTQIRERYQDPNADIGIAYTWSYTSLLGLRGTLNFTNFQWKYIRVPTGLSTNRSFGNLGVVFSGTGVTVGVGETPYPAGYVETEKNFWWCEVRAWLDGVVERRRARLFLNNVLLVDYVFDQDYTGEITPGTVTWEQTAVETTGLVQFYRNLQGMGVEISVGAYDADREAAWLDFQRNDAGYVVPAYCSI